MSKGKKIHPFIKLLMGLFVVFIALFIASKSGYYESKIREKVTMTEKEMQEFEESIEKGEEIDITAFLNKDRVDYSSKWSRMGDNLTSGVEKMVASGMEIITDIFKSLF